MSNCMVLNIQQMQHYVSEMLKETIKVCVDNDITYYAQAGTVLGTIRHGGTIPWDHDADIIIPNNEIDHFIECCLKDLPDRYYVDYYSVDDSTLRQFPRIGMKGYTTRLLHLDVFRLIGLPDDRQTQLDMIEEAHYYTKMNALMRKPMWKLIGKGQCGAACKKKADRLAYIKRFNELCSRYDYNTATFVMNPSGKYGKKNIFDKKVYGTGTERIYEDFIIRVPDMTEFYLQQYYKDYMKIPPDDEIKKEIERTFIVV